MRSKCRTVHRAKRVCYTRCSRIGNKVCIFFAVLVVQAAFLLQPAPRSEKQSLVLIFVSDRTPDIESFPWLPLLSLQSFVTLFKLPLHDHDVHARMYITCRKRSRLSEKAGVAPLNQSNIDGEYLGYAEIFTELQEIYRDTFAKIEIFCHEELSDAFCHTARILRPGSLVFLLEHDWILLPTQVDIPLYRLGEMMLHSRVPYDYALLQRGDRTSKRWRVGSALLKNRLYSNNPFLATDKFFTVALQHGICQASGENWERHLESRCKKPDAGCRLALIRPKRKTSLYHMDGRFFSFAKEHKLGPIFDGNWISQDLLENVWLYRHDIISRISEMCAPLPFNCDPYYLRHAFALTIRAHAVQEKWPTNMTSSEMVEKYVQNKRLASIYLSGQFPHRELSLEEL